MYRVSAKLVAFTALIAVAAAQEPEPPKDLVRRSQTARSGSDADKTIARARVVRHLIQEGLQEWSWDSLPARPRKALFDVGLDLIRRETFKLGRGRYRYEAHYSPSEFRARLLEALAVPKTFGSGRIHVAVDPKAIAPEGARIWEEVRARARAELSARTFRCLDAAAPRVRAAERGLGGTPDIAAINSLCDDLEVQQVVWISGEVRREPDQKTYRTLRLECLIYDRKDEVYLAKFSLKRTNEAETEASLSDPKREKVGPWVARTPKDTGLLGGALGLWVARGVSRRLFDREFMGRRAAPKRPSLPRDCLGCDFTVRERDASFCPVCDSALPGPPATGRRGMCNWAKPGSPVKLRLKGWSEDERAELVAALQANEDDFCTWKELGKEGVFYSYSLKVLKKEEAWGAIRQTLQDAGIEGWKLTKTGDKFNLLRRR